MELIKNFDTLATTQVRKDLLSAVEAGITAIHPQWVLRERIAVGGDTLMVAGQTFDLARYKKIYVGAIGKVSSSTCKVLEEMLGNRISAGLCIDTKIEEHLTIISQTVGTHPFPSKANFSFSSAIVNLIDGAGEDDLIILVISGGGSALFCYPYDSECEVGEPLTRKLMKKGASIRELNTVRKHLSLIKGGGLAKFAYPATVLALVFSDVPGDDLSYIASGPTVKDETTAADAKAVLDKYGIPFTGEFIETPKEDKYFQKVRNVLVCANNDALWKMREYLKSKGYDAEVYGTTVETEASATGRMLLDAAPDGTVLLAGGEMRVHVKGNGKGGRNTEAALGALQGLQEGETFIACASDGIDNTPVAGAVADAETARKAKEAGLSAAEYLAVNDSYGFFVKTGDLIETGYTGVNVSDLMLAYREKK